MESKRLPHTWKPNIGAKHHQLPHARLVDFPSALLGAPIPMIHCPKCGIVAVPEKDLPVLLPEEAEFKPTGESR